MREPEISAYELNDRLLDAALTHWNGMSLRDIPEKMFHDHDHHETHPKLQATVPEPYRKAVWQAQDNESPNRRHSIQILAIDSQGDALVKRYVVDDYLDADGSSYNVETKESAIAFHGPRRRDGRKG
ncbi:hypothetical protein G6F65_020213 [Rhizopus arrhizus]|nr:hypothetical protein G6F65_020213 [Rhizopus arrhizus]